MSLGVLIERLARERFGVTDPKRSGEYVAGFRAGAEYKLLLASGHRHVAISCPFGVGSVHFDAWFAGWDDGVACASRIGRQGEEG